MCGKHNITLGNSNQSTSIVIPCAHQCNNKVWYCLVLDSAATHIGPSRYGRAHTVNTVCIDGCGAV